MMLDLKFVTGFSRNPDSFRSIVADALIDGDGYER
jgi:hypothetical protein